MPGEVRKYGTTIAPGLYAPVHQHFFVARMDMAVDCKPGEALNQVTFVLLVQQFFSVVWVLMNEHTMALHLDPVILWHFDILSTKFQIQLFIMYNKSL